MKYIKEIYHRIIESIKKENGDTDSDAIIASVLTKQTVSLSVGFLEWSLSNKHCWDYNDEFCLDQNKGKWHDDNGNFITHKELFNKYIEYLENNKKYNLL